MNLTDALGWAESALTNHIDWMHEWRAQEEQHYDEGEYERFIQSYTEARDVISHHIFKEREEAL